jgi:peptidoglycan/LPS O-acetylase OafA/YrhL
VNSTNATEPALKRLDGIDVLRGVSILAVILLHIWIRFHFFDVRLGLDWNPIAAHLVWHNGGNGVTIFFAVSGFLITLTSLRRFGSLGTIRPAVFYRIRFARIMPLLLLLLAVLSVLHLAHVPRFVIDPKIATLPRAVLSALTFHLNWLEAARNGYLPACWTVLWSLSIEEMFYLFFPVVAVALTRRWRAGIWLWLLLALALVSVGPWARVVWPKNDLAAENSYLNGMSDIAMGCIAAVITERTARSGLRLSERFLLAMQVMGWSILALILVWPRWHVMLVLGKSGTDDTLLALGTSLVMVAVALRGVKSAAWTAPLRWLGRHSYELYLSHEFVVMAGAAFFGSLYPTPHGVQLNSTPHGTIAMFVLAIVALTAPLGWALGRFFAEPLNARLRGNEPERRLLGAPDLDRDPGHPGSRSC